MEPYGDDIYTEPDADRDTLANLGPLAPLAGTWEGKRGDNLHPIGPGSELDDGIVEDGGLRVAYIEHYDLQPIDPQTNGPQLFYGLRYHIHIVKPGDVETFHDQVGYWLWEPATKTISHTLAIPRGQVALAAGIAEPDATEFEVTATAGAAYYGILSNPFLDTNFQTLSFKIKVTVNGDGTWSYDEDTVMQLPDRPEPFHHTDTNTLTRVAAPKPNPVADTERSASPAGSS
jgi:hypothetical protein